LGLFSFADGRYSLLCGETFPSRKYDRLEKIVREFVKGQRTIDAACFGVAGPVIKGVVKTTNLPWTIRATSLKQTLGLPRIGLINDLIANAYGISLLKESDLGTLNVGRIKQGSAALIAAGTGLGQAILFWDSKHHVPSPSEGGHAEFGPKTLLEMDLTHYLLDRFGHVSYERVLSGPGLLNIYQFLLGSGKFGREPGWLSVQMKREDPATVITETARLGKNRMCSIALDLFASIYGAAAGNLALHVMAVGGIYVGGGIAPNIFWKLKDGTFMKSFRNKGRLSRVVADIPVKVILNDQTALWGAAYGAVELLKSSSTLKAPKGC
jgi:glucokinase